MLTNLRFVDDPHDVQSSDHASVLCGLSLSIVKVGGDCYHGVCDGVSKVSLSCLLHLCQHHCTDLFRCKEPLLSLDVHLDVRLLVLLSHGEREIFDVFLNGWIVPVSTNQTLGVEDCVLWVGGELVFGSVADQTLALGGEGHVGGGDPITLVISDDLNTAILVHTNTRGTKKNAKIMRYFP